MDDIINRLEYLRNTLANEHEEAVADAQNEIERLRAELAERCVCQFHPDDGVGVIFECDYHKRHAYYAREAYRRKLAEAGWKIVPIEPAFCMIDVVSFFPSSWSRAGLVQNYKAMLNAAPEPPK